MNQIRGGDEATPEVLCTFDIFLKDIYIVYPSLESECNVETGELIATFDISNQFRRGKGCSNMEVKLQK